MQGATPHPGVDVYAAQWFILSVSQLVNNARCVCISRSQYVSQDTNLKKFVKFKDLRYFERHESPRTFDSPNICPPWSIRNRGTNVQGNACPGGTLVRGDSCPGGQMSRGTDVLGGHYIIVENLLTVIGSLNPVYQWENLTSYVVPWQRCSQCDTICPTGADPLFLEVEVKGKLFGGTVPPNNLNVCMCKWGLQEEDLDMSNHQIATCTFIFCPFLAIYTWFLHVFLLSITIIFSKVSTIDSDSKILDR